MKRRNFIKTTAATSAGIMLAPKLLKAKKEFDLVPNEKLLSGSDDNVIIFIELFGGNDGLNTIIPADDSEYFKLRPTINIPKTVAIKVNDIYMNPALVTNVYNGGLKRMFEDGRLAIVEGIGYDAPNLSHFRSEDIWLSGINPKANNNIKLLEGWLGRYFASKLPNFPVEMPEHPLSIAIDGIIPLMFKSDKGHMGIALTDPDAFYKLGAGLAPKEDLMSGNSYYENEFNFIHTLAKQSELYSTAVKTAYDAGKTKINASIYSAGQLSQKLKMISTLIAGGLKTKVYFVKLSNFDSHAQQMSTDYTGQHATLLGEVAKSISEFMDDALKTGFSERVTGLTVSEFGRRAYDNGSRGTDHGAASMQFVWGNDKFVNGGYWNNRPKLTDLDINGNVKYQTDYRVIFAELLEKRLGATPADVTSVFGESFLPLNILETRTSVEDYIKSKDSNSINITPNPCFGNGIINFELSNPGFVDVTIFRTNGKVQQIIQRNYLTEGYYNIPFSINDSGTYICSITVGSKRYNYKFIVLK